MCLSSPAHLLPFCDTTVTLGRLLTTTSRGTATFGSKVSVYFISDLFHQQIYTESTCMLLRQRIRRAHYRIWLIREEWPAEHKAGKFTYVPHNLDSW